MGQWAREVINKYLLQPSVRWGPEDDVCGHISIQELLGSEETVVPHGASEGLKTAAMY